MKKLLALTLALVLALSMGVVAFAADDDHERDEILAPGTVGDGVFGLLVPDKAIKIPMEIIAPAVERATITDVITPFNISETKAGVTTNLEVVNAGDDLTTYVSPYDTATVLGYKTPKGYFLAALPTGNIDVSATTTFSNISVTVISAEDAWELYNDEKALKISVTYAKGAEYMADYAVKKSGAGELYVELKAKKIYLGSMPTVEAKVKLTVTDAKDVNEALPAALTATGSTFVPFERNDYVVFENDYKVGFNASTKVTELKNDSDTDYEVEQNLGANADGTSSIHFKKGTGDVYAFSYDDANVEVKMDNNSDVNLYMETAAIKPVLSAYPDADFMFYNWPGNPEFDFTATVELYVNEDDVGEKPFIYAWDGTNLTAVKADYEDETFVIKTRQLGAYVISDTELDITATATEAPAGSEVPVDGGATTTPNPGTGASDFVGVAVAMAVVSLAAAGAVALKK